MAGKSKWNSTIIAALVTAAGGIAVALITGLLQAPVEKSAVNQNGADHPIQSGRDTNIYNNDPEAIAKALRAAPEAGFRADLHDVQPSSHSVVSFIKVYSNADGPGVATFRLWDTKGAELGSFDVSLEAHETKQLSAKDLEEIAKLSPPFPYLYSVQITTTFPGAVEHIYFDPVTGKLDRRQSFPGEGRK